MFRGGGSVREDVQRGWSVREGVEYEKGGCSEGVGV